MFRISLFLLGLSLAVPSMGGGRPLYKKKHQVNRALGEVVSAPDFRSASFAFYAVDLGSGEVVGCHHPFMALQPASTLKLLTTATALELLGPEHRFTTTLEVRERIDSAGQVHPVDVVIRGGGDPALGSAYFPDSVDPGFLDQWVMAVRSAGIDSLEGRIIGDASIFGTDLVPPTWSWQNMGQYYGAGPCGLTIYDNTYSLVLQTGDRVGDTARLVRIEPVLPLDVECRVTSDSIRYDNSYIFGAPYSLERVISGTLPLSRREFRVRGSMPDPALEAAAALDSALEANGVATREEGTTLRQLAKRKEPLPPLSGRVIHTTLSPALGEIIAQTNTHSVNLFAEHLLMHAGLALGSVPETETAADSALAFWKNRGMDTEGLSMHDGSGLSKYNAISPVQLVWLLGYMKNRSDYRDEFYGSMAVAGVSGTLEPLCRGTVAEGKLRAKSGTISRAKAYAGYVTSVSGREIAFSMVVNGFSGSSVEARDKLEKLMVALAELDK